MAVGVDSRDLRCPNLAHRGPLTRIHGRSHRSVSVRRGRAARKERSEPLKHYSRAERLVRRTLHAAGSARRVLIRPGTTDLTRRILQHLEVATDLGSLSDELEHSARGWSELRELAKSAPNVLRALDLRPTHRILLLTSGCGALARYLGESCASVDVASTTPDLVQAIASRVRDLPNVRVALDAATDPRGGGYDVVVIDRSSSHPGLDGLDKGGIDLLERATRALEPGGIVIWMAANRLSVQQVANRGVPAETGATRAGMEADLQSLGFEFRFLSVFPEIINAQVLIDDSLFRSPEASLAWRLPRFRRNSQGTKARQLWRSLTIQSKAIHFAPALLAIAWDPSGTPAHRLWGTEMEAYFFSIRGHSSFMTGTAVRRTGTSIRFERRRLAGSEKEVRLGPLIKRIEDSDFINGSDLFERLEYEGETWVRHALQRWLELVTSRADRVPTNIDLIPRNLIVAPDGDLVSIDHELYHMDYGVSELLGRGILDTVLELAALPALPIRAHRYRDVALRFGSWVGLNDKDWLPQTVHREAVLRALLQGYDTDPKEWRRGVARYERQFSEVLRRRIPDQPSPPGGS